jgi:hypothetical protein
VRVAGDVRCLDRVRYVASQPSGEPSTTSQTGINTLVRGRLWASTVTIVAYPMEPT